MHVHDKVKVSSL